MKNPLRKRIPREMGRDWKKYLALFLLMTVTIGFVSGMFVANGSMETAALEAYEKYNIEDGHFNTKEELDETLQAAFEDEGIAVTRQYYKEVAEDVDGDGQQEAVARVFVMREEVNLACLMEGEFPTREDQVLIDRMHADNQSVAVGDVISLGGRKVTVSGLAAFPDYSTLFEENGDVMFNALTFDVAAMTREGYESLNARETYQYAFTYNEPPETVAQQKEMADDLAEELAVLAITGGMLDDVDAAEELQDNVKEWTDYLEGVQEQADALEARGDELKARQQALEDKAAALQEKIAGMTPAEQFAQAESLQQESEALQKEGERLQQDAQALQEEADALEVQRDKIDETADKLKALEPYQEHENELTDFVPEYANRAIHFAPDDFGNDKSMGEVLLIILVAVLAFIFALTESSTITEEAAVIGTLRASGYTRGELLRHYLALPVLVTLLSALVGNLLGYGPFKEVVVSMYYNSYSLPTYETLWNADGFIKTTVYPLLLVLAVNLLVIARKLRFTPLQFLRRDLSSSKRKKAVRLPRWSFFRRFRLRILFQNATGYLTLFLGTFFVMVLLAFSVGMPATLRHYQDHAAEYVLADYQVLLKSTEDQDGEPVTTTEPTAEKVSVTALKTVGGVHPGEEVTVYGYQPESRYFSLPDTLGDGEIWMSRDYGDKFGLKAGETVTLQDKYTEKTYTFTAAGFLDLPGSIAAFLPNETFNQVFDREKDSFSGFLSQRELTDIDPDLIVSVITVEDALKMAKQLDHSMGSYMTYFSVVCVLVAMLLIFLLTKLIIERSTVSISMVKVLGYENREIDRLYIRLTTVVVALSAVATAFLSVLAVGEIWKVIMYRFNGWFTFTIGWQELLLITAAVIFAYGVVALLDMRRIRRIPLTEALKNVE